MHPNFLGEQMHPNVLGEQDPDVLDEQMLGIRQVTNPGNTNLNKNSKFLFVVNRIVNSIETSLVENIYNKYTLPDDVEEYTCRVKK